MLLFIAAIVWIWVRPNFLPSDEWILLAARPSTIAGLVIDALLVLLFVRVKPINKEFTWVHLLTSLFLSYCGFSSSRLLGLEALPFVLSGAGDQIALVETGIQDGVVSELGDGWRIVEVAGYERLLPIGNREAIYCVDHRWSVEITGLEGRWGLHIHSVVARQNRTDLPIIVDYQNGTRQLPEGC